jgi:hypothetical protein
MWKMPLYNHKDECILVACFFTVIPAFSWTFHEYVQHWLNVPPGDTPGGSDSPLYFMRQDVVWGICSATAMLLSLVLVALTWKRFPQGSSHALWFSWLWTMPWVASGLVTLCRSSHLMDPQKATAGWATAHDYIADPIRHGAMILMMLTALAMSFLMRRYRWGNRLDPGAKPHLQIS